MKRISDSPNENSKESEVTSVRERIVSEKEKFISKASQEIRSLFACKKLIEGAQFRISLLCRRLIFERNSSVEEKKKEIFGFMGPDEK